MVKIIFFGLLIMLISCHSTTTSNSNDKITEAVDSTPIEVYTDSSLKFVENLNYYTGYFSFMTETGSFGGKEYIIISDYVTHKKIAIHDLNSDEVVNVSLKKILTDYNEKIEVCEVVNFDTILVLTQYTNKLYFLNRKGEPWKIIDFSSYLTLDDGFYWLTKCATPFLFNDSTLMFSLEFRPKAGSLSTSEDGLQYHNKRYSYPKLLKVSNFYHDFIRVEFGMRNLYNQFTDSTHVAYESNNFEFIGDKIIFYSAYSDTLYIIGSKSMEIENKVQIISKYSNLFIQPVTSELAEKEPNAINDRFKSDGQIRGISFDPNNERYFVFVNHKPTNGKETWSIIVTDSLFKQQDEILMDESKYVYYYALMTSRGLLISNSPEVEKDKDYYKKNTKALFIYEK